MRDNGFTGMWWGVSVLVAGDEERVAVICDRCRIIRTHKMGFIKAHFYPPPPLADMPLLITSFCVGGFERTDCDAVIVSPEDGCSDFG